MNCFVSKNDYVQKDCLFRYRDFDIVIVCSRFLKEKYGRGEKKNMRDTGFIISGQAYFFINSWENFKGNECPGVYINLSYAIIRFFISSMS